MIFDKLFSSPSRILLISAFFPYHLLNTYFCKAKPWFWYTLRKIKVVFSEVFNLRRVAWRVRDLRCVESISFWRLIVFLLFFCLERSCTTNGIMRFLKLGNMLFQARSSWVFRVVVLRAIKIYHFLTLWLINAADLTFRGLNKLFFQKARIIFGETFFLPL